MTGLATTRPVAEKPLLYRVASLARNIPDRLHEREFWITQAGALGVTTIHILAEAWASQLDIHIPSALHHIPVILYLAPIAYASLKFGTEGAVLTGLWCAVLTLPNLFIWHTEELEWLEIVYVMAVLVAGVTMSVPVERERAQRRRAEATTQRLGLLNEIATLTLTADLRSTLNQTSSRLLDMLDLDAVCVALVGESNSSGRLSVVACHPPSGQCSAELREALLETEDLQITLGGGSASLIAARMEADLPGSASSGRVDGLLAVKHKPGRPPSAGDIRLLNGVASHLAVAVANQRLMESERDRLRTYAKMVTKAQEDERMRIARELHDEASQNVVVIRRTLADLAVSLDGLPAATELVELARLAGETLIGMRRFSHDLRPPTLDQLGVASALEQLASEVRERSGLGVRLEVTGWPRRLPIDKELAVFRIGQAALHNVERHAQADTVTTELIFEPDRVRLEIADDGCGFEVPGSLDVLPESGKLGLIGMHERAALVGGNLRILSRPGGGTRLTLEVEG